MGFSPWMDSCNHHYKQVQGNPNIPKDSLVLPLFSQTFLNPLTLSLEVWVVQSVI